MLEAQKRAKVGNGMEVTLPLPFRSVAPAICRCSAWSYAAQPFWRR
jgi:hypothetical protein